MYYGARFYDPALGRFLVPDTIVPNAGNLQALNRYSYVLNNPLRFVDPTGYFTEDEIMEYLGVETWDEVLAQFSEGEALEGRWGWLETLRYAQLGETIAVRESVSSYSDEFGSFPTIFTGVFAEQSGQLVVVGSYGSQSGARQGETATLSATAAAALAPATWESGVHQYWSTSSIARVDWKTSYLRCHPELVDWANVGLDAGGNTADLLRNGVGGRYVNALQARRVAGKVGTGLDIASTALATRSFVDAASQGSLGWGEVGDAVLAGARLWVPVVPDAVNLVVNLSAACRWSP